MSRDEGEIREPSSPMRVLVGLDDKAGAAHLLSYVQLLGRTNALIARVVHVIEQVTPRGETVTETQGEAATLVDEAVFVLRMAGIGTSGTVRHGRVNRIAAVFLEEAARWQADMVVVSGRRSSGWQRLSGRGVREQLLRHSLRPIVLVSVPARASRSTRHRQLRSDLRAVVTGHLGCAIESGNMSPRDGLRPRGSIAWDSERRE
jgi:nucleotide-binding universal stress UspA family protein